MSSTVYYSLFFYVSPFLLGNWWWWLIFHSKTQRGIVDAAMASCRHAPNIHNIRPRISVELPPHTEYHHHLQLNTENHSIRPKQHHGPRSSSLHVRPAVCRLRPSPNPDKIPNGSEIRRHLDSSNQPSCKYVDKPHLHSTDLTIKSHTSRRNSSGRHPPRNRLSRLRVRPAISQEISLQKSLWLIPGSSG
jgi:hypothetical protein